MRTINCQKKIDNRRLKCVAEHSAEIKTFNEKIKKYTECTHSSLFSLCFSPSTLLYTNSGQVVFIMKTGHDHACVDKTTYTLRIDHPDDRGFDDFDNVLLQSHVGAESRRPLILHLLRII